MMNSKKSKAGKRSGVKRARLARTRQFSVLMAYERLKPKYRMQPFSTEAIDALEAEFRELTQGRPSLSELIRRQPLSEEAKVLIDEAVEGLRAIDPLGKEFLVLSRRRSYLKEIQKQPLSEDGETLLAEVIETIESDYTLEEEFRWLTRQQRSKQKREHSFSEEAQRLFDEVVEALLKDQPGEARQRDVSRDTLIKDLKTLGVRSKRRKQ